MDKELILRLERLSKLKLSDVEREKVFAETGEVIEYFNILSELDTNGVGPLSHASGLVNVTREDEPAPSFSQEEITANAKCENGFFVSPISVENGGKKDD
ncbi:MAG: Asp-tRNA(Asn)/Glu-tRNA(Gln) amidotransferase subunit GatC [Eubacterium sp.]|nr:Asp-tRNA(Asn)/Glu-tRNA(Gln) amidotransferase subunit GatC [Eubacterium sp.]